MDCAAFLSALVRDPALSHLSPSERLECIRCGNTGRRATSPATPRWARPSVQLPTGSRGSRGYRDGRGKCKLGRCARCGLGRKRRLSGSRRRKLNLIRSAPTKHVADFPQLLPRRNSQISARLLYRSCKQEPAKKKRVPCVYASRSTAVYSGWTSGIGGR